MSVYVYIADTHRLGNGIISAGTSIRMTVRL